MDLSPGSAIVNISSDPADDPDVVVTGSTPPASQVSRRRPGTGHADDPVLVEDTPRAGPKKIVFASDTSKPAHSFFGPRPTAVAPAATTEQETESGAATTAKAPTNGTSTPTAANGSAAGKVHSFFSSNGKPAPGTMKKGWGNCREGAEPAAPLPGGEWPNHVDGDDASDSQPSTSSLPFRQRPPLPERDAPNGFWMDVLTRARASQPSPQTSLPPLISASPFILEHPAIAAVLADTRPDDRRESWCDRHRPREAAAVLGNELEAAYLRDWLKALSIGQAESRKIIRRVPRRKIANPDLSWIVDDIGLFGEPEDHIGDGDLGDLPEPYEEPFLGPGERPNSYPPLGVFIGNTIVLTGPSGSGKSAAVHAVATELGWDVFEVYPGIGKRTGPNLVNLVGDVGKNHMVNDSKKKSAAAAAQAMFAKAKPKLKPPPTGSQGSAQDPIDLDDDAPAEVPDTAHADANTANPATNGANSAPKTKQSLILIDEADILFDEASTFWPTLVSLIAESRRPVVITCNGELWRRFPGSSLADASDLASVPTDILPLQVILHFHSAPSYLAQPYLASIASKHGFTCDVPQLFHYCSQPCLPNLVEGPLPPNGNEPERRFDLRAAVTQMQLDRDSASGRRSERHSDVSDRDHDLGDWVRRIDTESFADAYVTPRSWARLEVSCAVIVVNANSVRSTRATGLRQRVMTRTVSARCANPTSRTSIRHLRHTALPARSQRRSWPCAAAAWTVRTNFNTSSESPHTTVDSLANDRTSYVRSLLPFLDPLVPLSARLLPHPSLFLDVVPWVRNMVLADDAYEVADRAAAASGEARINPRTGRAMRVAAQEYERWITLGEEGLAAARSGGWGP